jgi:hypothetical protein
LHKKAEIAQKKYKMKRRIYIEKTAASSALLSLGLSLSSLKLHRKTPDRVTQMMYTVILIHFLRIIPEMLIWAV